MAPRRLWRKKPAVRRRRPVRRVKIPRRIPGVYRFKRLCMPVRIYHNPPDAANVWRIEDPQSILSPAFSGGAAWPAESLASTYQNQFGCTFRLSQVSSPLDFTTLYDQYKITGVKVTFMYQISEAGTTGAGVLPTILYSTDDTDATPPTYSALRQKQSVKQRILTANRPFSIFLRPKRAAALLNSTFTTNSIVNSSGYIDTASSTADHFGLKFSLNNLYGTTAVAAQLEMKLTYYLSFKHPQ